MGLLDSVDTAVDPLVRRLQYRTRRHQTIAANIANADTPGYRAVDVTFAGALERAGVGLIRTDPRHLGGAHAVGHDAVVQVGGLPRRDGNDVDIDSEMAKLARNQIEYQFLTRVLGTRFRWLKEAITGRLT